MNEEEKPKEKEEESPAPEADASEEKTEESSSKEKSEGESEERSDSTSPIDSAKELLTNLQQENKKFEKNLKELKKITAEGLVTGRSMAGKEKTKEDKLIEEAKRLAGSLGDGIFEARK